MNRYCVKTPEFGDRAMAMFGDYEEMTVYRPGTQISDGRQNSGAPGERNAGNL